MPTLMNERAALQISGPEARDYLHSLVTNDIAGLGPGRSCWAGLLTPQGKILFDFFVHALKPDHPLAPQDGEGDVFLLDVSAAQRADLMKRLGMYRLRRQVEIRPRDDLAIVVDLPADEEAEAVVYEDPRHAPMGTRAFLPVELAGDFPADPYLWHARRIAMGLPDTEADIGTQQLFPHEANFDQLGGVSFDKGCYVGQEVVSRMQHRGTARNRLLPVIGTEPLEPGMEVAAGGRRIGEVRSTSGERAMALIRLDRAAKAAEEGHPLMAHGKIGLRIVQPEWADFEIPGAVSPADTMF